MQLPEHCFFTLWVLRSSTTLHPYHCYLPFFTFTEDFETHLSTPSPITALTSSVPVIFSCTLLLPGGPCQQPKLLCDRTPSPPSPLVALYSSYLILTLFSHLPRHYLLMDSSLGTSLQPSCRHIQPSFFAFSTIQLFAFLFQTHRRLNAAGENHKTTQICANKNSASNLSTTKQSFYMPWSALSPLSHKDNPIFYYLQSPSPSSVPLSLTR